MYPSIASKEEISNKFIVVMIAIIVIVFIFLLIN